MIHKKLAGGLLATLALAACNNQTASESAVTDTALHATAPGDTLPKPFATKSSNNFSKVIGWPANGAPVAPEGFTVTRFADSLDNPRWIYVAPNGDVFVAEANSEITGLKKIAAQVSGKGKSQDLGEGANHVLLLRDANKDGKVDQRFIFADNLKQPLGMLAVGNSFYIANTDAVLQFPYTPGLTKLEGAGKRIVELPAKGYNNHWTRNIITNATGDKLYISVGSASNVGEHGMEYEVRRANILETALDGSGERIYASGLRNPVGMDWAPGTNVLWTAVNERDGLGDDLVPDYMTSVQPGGFYGWPYSYFGRHADPRLKDDPKPELVKKAIVPDVPLGSHTASLGLVFNRHNGFPEKYKSGAFVGQHGSWNRSQLAGYKVVFVPFRDGKAAGKPEDFLTGFIANADKSEVYGRPVGVAQLPDGSLLVADDAGDVIWRVAPNK